MAARHAALPGFRDFYPDEMRRRQQIFSAWRDVAIRYGFEEYDGPPLESLDLYIEKSGPEIVGQLFNFVDKGGREVALRPEMTPTLVRMLGARIKGLPRPVRWFSTPQLFRYEKQQRGRLREHFQLNMDIIGEESVLADADLLAAALDVLRSLGLKSDDVVARYSDRRLLHQALLELGVTEENLAVAYNVFDKVDRDPREVCIERLAAIGLSAKQADDALSLTSMTPADLERRFSSNTAFAPILQDLDQYRSALGSLGFADWIQLDMKIVRGLAYYTGIVFEIFDRKGQLRAICGGGRYDNLFSALAGIDVPALGFGFGDVVLGELLKDRGLAATGGQDPDVYVIATEPGVDILRIVAFLRERGRSVLFAYRQPDRMNLGKSLKAASSANAKDALLAGDLADPIGNTQIIVKNLSTGEQRNVSLSTYIEVRV
ncbi:MAG TPA: histidine--tRNA ligase [Thermoanaerobaculia bacterium]|nr:histidine--tRNA ligase [Thermoanaerobaculia bacterium]